MDSREAASMTALILTGVSKERASARFGRDPEFSQLWDDIAADIEKQRKENPKVQFAIPNEMPDLGEADDGPAPKKEPATPASPEPDTGSESAAPDGPAVANLKKKAEPPR